MEDLVQRIQLGFGVGPLTSVALAGAVAVAACLLLPRLPWFRELSSAAPGNNPCHSSGRKSKIGGIAVVGGALLVATLVSGTASPWRALPIYLGGLFLIGLLDDLQPLTPGWKIILQVPMALFVVLSIPREGWVHLGLPWVFLQVAWIVVMTNAFNIVDVADGLLAGLALPVLALMGGVHLVIGAPDVAILCLAFTGALLGFLVFNASPGGVILGDSGSLPIGGLVSFLVLLIPSSPADAPTPLLALPLTGVVALEVLWVSVRRIRRGIPPWRGSPHHLIYWIIERGVPLPLAVVLLVSAQILLLLPFAAIMETWSWLIPAGATLLILIAAPFLRRARDAG
ncbi:MAG: MraY family glycosyltransferase [Pseudomonadota bacterium]